MYIRIPFINRVYCSGVPYWEGVDYIRIGVDFGVTRSTTQGNAKASKCGMSNDIVRAFFVLDKNTFYILNIFCRMKTIRIGRSHSNDCVLANPSVSGTHAILTLDSDEQNGVLKDLNSKNGTYVNNKAIREVRVARTDSVRFGSEVMTIGEIIVKANSNRTRVERPVGAEQRIVGKGSDCQIRFTQDDVSRRHAILYKTFAGEVVIEDCDSTNGTYVNGVKIRRQTLHPGDKVTITRNYLLNWESYFRPADVHKSVPASANRTFAMVGAVVLCVLSDWGITAGAGLYHLGTKSVSMRRITRRYVGFMWSTVTL